MLGFLTVNKIAPCNYINIARAEAGASAINGGPGVICGQCFLSSLRPSISDMTQTLHQEVFPHTNNTVDTVDYEEFYSSPDIPEWVSHSPNRIQVLSLIVKPDYQTLFQM